MESLRLVTEKHIDCFTSYHDGNRTTERIMSESMPTGGCLTHVQRARIQKVISDMANLRLSHGIVQSHCVMNSNPDFEESLSLLVELEILIAKKRQKIIRLAAVELITESPAYMRSHLFDAERFGRLAIERSFVSPSLYGKWMRLGETVSVAKTRLHLLQTLLEGISEFFTKREMTYDMESIERQMKDGNKRLMKKIVAVT